MCEFDKAPTLAILAFEAVVVIGSFVMLYVLSRFKNKVVTRYLTVAVGVLIFEVFTGPMWNNFKLGVWAYVYQDVSWILTLGWSTLILSTVLLVDHFFNKLSAAKRFLLYLAVLTVLVFIAEAIVVNLGIRSYSPEVLDTIIGVYIVGVPIEGLYYVPVFMTLVISFYKYWAFAIDQELLVPVVKGKWLRNLGIAAVGVLLFELMIEPMVINANFPSWSYIYRDITFLMTALWVIVIWLSTNLIDKYFIHFGLQARFIGYLLAVGALALPIESWFIRNGYRVYGPSAEANFTGFVTPITNVPAEVAFAIPLYMALIVSFIRFWEIVRDNGK
jgi:hypothetical protein